MLKSVSFGCTVTRGAPSVDQPRGRLALAVAGGMTGAVATGVVAVVMVSGAMGADDVGANCERCTPLVGASAYWSEE
jgi:hypothetical protein